MASWAGLLVVTLAKDFASCRIDEMGLSARQAGERLVGVVRHFLGGKALYGLAGVRAAVQERCHLALRRSLCQSALEWAPRSASAPM